VHATHNGLNFDFFDLTCKHSIFYGEEYTNRCTYKRCKLFEHSTWFLFNARMYGLFSQSERKKAPIFGFLSGVRTHKSVCFPSAVLWNIHRNTRI